MNNNCAQKVFMLANLCTWMVLVFFCAIRTNIASIDGPYPTNHPPQNSLPNQETSPSFFQQIVFAIQNIKLQIRIFCRIGRYLQFPTSHYNISSSVLRPQYNSCIEHNVETQPPHFRCIIPNTQNAAKNHTVAAKRSAAAHKYMGCARTAHHTNRQ